MSPPGPRDPHDPAADQRDDLDALIRKLLPPSAPLPPPHIDEDTLIAHFQRALPVAARAEMLRHLSRCALCCDRLEACADALAPLDALSPRSLTQRSLTPRLLTPPSALAPQDLGDLLMHVHLLVSADAGLHVITTDAEMRAAPALLMRRAAARPGLAFQRRLPHFTLQLTLVGVSSTLVHASISLTPPPADAHVRLLAADQVLASEPLRAGHASFRALPVRSLRLCVRADSASPPIGHVRLDLDPPSPHATLPLG